MNRSWGLPRPALYLRRTGRRAAGRLVERSGSSSIEASAVASATLAVTVTVLGEAGLDGAL